MAFVVVAGCGTLGDHLPLVGLGQALESRGHRVRMAFNTAMSACAERAGLATVRYGVELGPQQARQHAECWDHWNAPQEVGRRWTEHDDDCLIAACRSLHTACRGADLLITSVNDEAGALVYELVGLPWVTLALMPAAFAFPRRSLESATSEIERAYHRSFAEHLRRVRRRLKLRDRPLERQEDNLYAPRKLLASSPSFSPALSSDYEEVHMTGFWFYDEPEWLDWQPSGSLARFVEEGPPPLVLSFSSLPLVDAPGVLAAHARAAASLGMRLVVQRGWAGFTEQELRSDASPQSVRFVDAIPHDWLFARAGVCILHGGIGSVARAIRAGCPMVIEPYGNDQFYNARQVVALGLGAAMHPHRLTPAGLARVIREKVLQPECRARVEALGAVIRAEDGLTRACDLLEEWLCRTNRK
jgi:UDP:flavonoid glycosyltransferase YjiC (YdhE family)